MRISTLASVSVLAAVASANAGIDAPAFRVDVQMGGESGFFEVQWGDIGSSDGGFAWELGDSVDIMSDGGNVLGTLDSASIALGVDRSGSQTVALDFNVFAGVQNSVFTINSGILSFATLDQVVGAASAGVSVTDTNGDGATLAANGAGMYRSQYNGVFPTGTDFATLLASPVSAAGFSTVTSSEDFMGGAFVPIGTTVDDISAAWQISLTAFDQASGTSVFTVVPAPGSMALLGAGTLLAARRRR